MDLVVGRDLKAKAVADFVAIDVVVDVKVKATSRFTSLLMVMLQYHAQQVDNDKSLLGLACGNCS